MQKSRSNNNVPENNIVVVNNAKEYIESKKTAESILQRNADAQYIEGLTHEQVIQKITQLIAENKVLQTNIDALEKEIEECEKILNIKCTPENIVTYKNSLDKSMRTALKNIQDAENALLEETKDVPDDVRRKWFEDVINSTYDTTYLGHDKLKK